MPGFLAGLTVQREERTGAVVLTSASTGARAEELALDLAVAALDALPRKPVLWQPADAPVDLRPLLGVWWSEGNELVIRHRGGRLEVELIGGPAGRSVSVLAEEASDRYRVVEGRELGELVRVVRDEAGAVVKVYFATYPMTRQPTTFG